MVAVRQERLIEMRKLPIGREPAQAFPPQTGFWRLRFEEYVGGSPGRAFPEESPKVQSCSGAKNEGNLNSLSFAVYVRELNAR